MKLLTLFSIKETFSTLACVLTAHVNLFNIRTQNSRFGIRTIELFRYLDESLEYKAIMKCNNINTEVLLYKVRVIYENCSMKRVKVAENN